MLLFPFLFLIKHVADAQVERTPNAASNVKSFSNPINSIGAAQNTVNLFTGDVSLPVELVSFSSRDGLGVSVNISYSSNVQNQVDTWNLDAPTGILGLGWSMDIPKIVCDHKSTGTREDDTYYLLEGGTSNRLIRSGIEADANGSYNTYQAKNYKFWQIRFYFDPNDYGLTGSGANKWVIIKENGYKYVYGDKDSGRSTIQYVVRWNNWIGNSSNISGQTQMASAWNLSEVVNLVGEKLTFEYLSVDQPVGAGGINHTEASYLKQIVDPIGRKVQFFYNEKAAQFYTEPHTEQPEPDAYQEVYERKYLDRIEVFQEENIKYLSVHLRYTAINDGMNTAKMLLARIEQRNGNGQSPQPATQFDYYTSTTTNGYKGFLQKITYPTGAQVSYSYQMSNNSIGHSNRNLSIAAPAADADGPAGYGVPKVWFGPDYVVVAWRALSPVQGAEPQDNPDPASVKMYVYQWVGEWVSKSLQTIPSVSAWQFYITLNNFQRLGNLEYSDFQIALEEDFFVILAKSDCSNCYKIFAWNKDDATRGNWLPFSTTVSRPAVETQRPRLITGSGFVFVGSQRYQDCMLLELMGTNWITPALAPIPPAQYSYRHSYGGTNNYHFVQASDTNGDAIYFRYYDENRTWSYKTIPAGFQNRAINNESNWYASNSFITGMIDSNPEYIYKWDLTYSTFVKDNGGSNLLGLFNDQSYVFTVDNSLIGVVDKNKTAVSLRYDGANWIKSQSYLPTTLNKVTFAPDLSIYSSDATHFNILSYNPNTNSWSSSVYVTSAQSDTDNASCNFRGYFGVAGNNNFRMPNGGLQSVSSSKGTWGNNFFLASDGGNPVVSSTGVKIIRNGAFTNANLIPTTPYSTAIGVDRYFTAPQVYSTLVGQSTIVAFNTYPFPYSTWIYLHRVVNENIAGLQVDYPVSSITVSDANSTNQSVALRYNFTTATLDPTGSVAQYAEVDLLGGTNSVFSKPNGYTKTRFNNSLYKSIESGIPLDKPVSAGDVGIDLRWVGLPYMVEHYNATDNLISNSSSNFSMQLVPVVNTDRSLIKEYCYYLKVLSTATIINGIETKSTFTFDDNSGQVRSEIKSTTNSSNSTQIDYQYWYEKYDPSKSKNILWPTVQISKKLNGAFVESKISRWKNWNANLIGSNFPAECDAYTWKRDGSNPLSFSVWDPSTPAGAEWQLVSKVLKRDDNTGQVLESTANGNAKSSVIYDQTKARVFAQVSNAGFDEIAYTGFEDASKGNWTWSDGSITNESVKIGSNSMIIGTSGITKSGLVADETYVISFWMRRAAPNVGAITVDGVADNIAWDDFSTTWNFYEFKVKGLTSLTIKRAGSGTVYFDEVRLYPSRARITTQTYHPFFGISSQTDSNNQTIYTDYDEFGRTKGIMDNEKNIISNTIYNYKKQ